MSTNIIADIVAFWLSDSLDHPDRAWPVAAGGTRAVRWSTKKSVSASVIWCRAPARASSRDWRILRTARWPDLLLDQFTRNLYRCTVEAYAGDPCAFEIVNHAVDQGLDRELHPVATIWLYHPFHHSEDLAEQDRGLGLLRTLRQHANPTWHAYVERSIKGWTRHRDIVARFGRFPHRNAVLGRHSTAEERAYLVADGNSFVRGRRRTAQPADGKDSLCRTASSCRNARFRRLPARPVEFASAAAELQALCPLISGSLVRFRERTNGDLP